MQEQINEALNQAEENGYCQRCPSPSEIANNLIQTSVEFESREPDELIGGIAFWQSENKKDGHSPEMARTCTS